jgi:hypothetical protein
MPYNFLFHSKSYEFKKQGHFFMSFVKEEIDTESTTDEYANIVVHETIFDPMPSPKIKRFWILMTQYNFSPKEIEWIEIDLEEPPEDFSRFLDNYSKDNKTRRLFISSVLKIPPVQIDLFYNGVATFCLPKSLLDSKI